MKDERALEGCLIFLAALCAFWAIVVIVLTLLF